MADRQLATLQQFQERHGIVDSDQAGIVQALLDDASALILDEVAGSTATWVAGTDLAPRAVVAVCVEVAYRAWSNPDALAQTRVGDVSASYRPGEPDALWLTDRERRIVQRAADHGGSMISATMETPYSGVWDSTTDLLS